MMHSYIPPLLNYLKNILICILFLLKKKIKAHTIQHGEQRSTKLKQRTKALQKQKNGTKTSYQAQPTTTANKANPKGIIDKPKTTSKVPNINKDEKPQLTRYTSFVSQPSSNFR